VLKFLPDKLSQDPLRLEQISDRLDLINSLKHKHRVKDITALLDTLAGIKTYLEQYSSMEHEISSLEKRIEIAFESLCQIADALSEKRVKTARKLEKELQTNIRKLAMPDATFEIKIDKNDREKNSKLESLGVMGENGQDRIEYLFSANRGATKKPLGAVASGGELSRILLAIKRVLNQTLSPRLMILDEIDAGIGGKTALMIAEFIKDLAARHSLICISHLAQIAAVADQHIALSKRTWQDKTIVDLTVVDSASRREEIARMLSGDVTETSLKHAEELLDRDKR
ncbi:MAG: DNA repair protein RecN, partial [Candidatus Cloacimonadaceae bacterium]|nr:DNA repair protein RecN [Candidatus Cloacimonadaceae bacterium]